MSTNTTHVKREERRSSSSGDGGAIFVVLIMAAILAAVFITGEIGMPADITQARAIASQMQRDVNASSTPATKMNAVEASICNAPSKFTDDPAPNFWILPKAEELWKQNWSPALVDPKGKAYPDHVDQEWWHAWDEFCDPDPNAWAFDQIGEQTRNSN